MAVNKMITTRFYSGQGLDANNPDRGTVIDSAIVSDEVYDFYLCAHKAR